MRQKKSEQKQIPEKAEKKEKKPKEKASEADLEKKQQMKGHRERLRKRFIDEGLDSFRDDYEVLELLLQFAVPYKDTKGAAKKLIEHFGSLPEVMDASYEELLKADVPNVKDTAAVMITLVRQMENRYQKTKAMERTHIRSTADAGLTCTAMFRNQPDESVRIICLNAAGKILKRAEVARGDVNAVHFPIRKIVETAISSNAVSVILTHNHPGGTLTPSREDLDATEAARAALETIGVRLLDHLIVSGTNYCSLREEGYF